MTRDNAIDRLCELLDENDEYYSRFGNRVWWGRPIDAQTGEPINVFHNIAEPAGGDRLRVELQLATPEQAVAATVGGGECIPHGEWKRISQTQEVRHVFCECGYELGMDERDSFPFERTRLFAMPNYCQECGRKIRRAVKR